MIDSYQLGQIKIDGKKYFKDLILFSDGRVLSWQRKEGHFLVEDDLKEIPLEDIEILVIGTGASGVMRISDTLISDLEEKGLEIFILKTKEATQKFNKFVEQKKKVAGAFHLTC